MQFSYSSFFGVRLFQFRVGIDVGMRAVDSFDATRADVERADGGEQASSALPSPETELFL